MTRNDLSGLVLILTIPLAGAAGASEGMWTLDRFPSERVAQETGARIGSDWLDHVQRSVVRIDGGCTGSFASPDGLVLTNNHCTWRCIGRLSSAELNLSETGFLAASREDEMQCPGERISVLMATEEVTDKVAAATADLSDERANAVRKQMLGELEKQCEATSGGLACESVTLYHGGQYFLYKYKRYDDVRLAFAPELAIAAFGGDPDNFNFPRYCLDMSFFRVYEDGKPAKTPEYLRWRPAGPDAGEAVFVVGHPGSTQRLLTMTELLHLRNYSLPRGIESMAERRGRLIEWGKTGDERRRIARQRILGLENGLKVNRNRLYALLDEANIERKARQELELRQAVMNDPALRRYASAWTEIDHAFEAYEEFEDPYRWIGAGQAFRSRLYDYAETLVRAAAERPKASTERLPEYRDVAIPRLERQLLAPVPISPDYEKLTLVFSLEKMLEHLGPDDVYVRRILGTEGAEALALRLIDGTELADVAARRRLWQGGQDAIATSDDPMIRFVAEHDADARALRRRYEDTVQAPIAAASERLAKARFAVFGTSRYPDATFTLRVSYGTVKGWLERGKPVDPFTRVGTTYDRATGHDPFRLPESWLEHRADLPPDLPFNFVADTDIIGGNSGSPVIDERGRLVGLVFDGNIHSIAGDYLFDPEKNRTVAVHPAVIVETLREVYGASNLLEELGLTDE